MAPPAQAETLKMQAVAASITGATQGLDIPVVRRKGGVWAVQVMARSAGKSGLCKDCR